MRLSTVQRPVEPGGSSSRASFVSMRSVFHSKFPCATGGCNSPILHFFMMCFNTDLSSWRLVLELFLREDVSHCRASLLRTFLGFDLRLVRLVLDSVFRSSPGPPVNFRLRTNLDVRFDSLDFVSA